MEQKQPVSKSDESFSKNSPGEDHDGPCSRIENAAENKAEIASDENSKASTNVSSTDRNTDFRQTAKYKDLESYVGHHHHSIGTGLYLTDEFEDLPPRFRVKVIKVLESAAALNNIPLNRNPVEYFSSTTDDFDTKKECSDSLVTSSTIKSDGKCGEYKPSFSQNCPGRNSSSRGRTSNKYNNAQNISKSYLTRDIANRPSFLASDSFCKSKNFEPDFQGSRTIVSKENTVQEIRPKFGTFSKPVQHKSDLSSLNPGVKPFESNAVILPTQTFSVLPPQSSVLKDGGPFLKATRRPVDISKNKQSVNEPVLTCNNKYQNWDDNSDFYYHDYIYRTQIDSISPPEDLLISVDDRQNNSTGQNSKPSNSSQSRTPKFANIKSNSISEPNTPFEPRSIYDEVISLMGKDNLNNHEQSIPGGKDTCTSSLSENSLSQNKSHPEFRNIPLKQVHHDPQTLDNALFRNTETGVKTKNYRKERKANSDIQNKFHNKSKNVFVSHLDGENLKTDSNFPNRNKFEKKNLGGKIDAESNYKKLPLNASDTSSSQSNHQDSFNATFSNSKNVVDSTNPFMDNKFGSKPKKFNGSGFNNHVGESSNSGKYNRNDSSHSYRGSFTNSKTQDLPDNGRSGSSVSNMSTHIDDGRNKRTNHQYNRSGSSCSSVRSSKCSEVVKEKNSYKNKGLNQHNDHSKFAGKGSTYDCGPNDKSKVETFPKIPYNLPQKEFKGNNTTFKSRKYDKSNVSDASSLVSHASTNDSEYSMNISSSHDDLTQSRRTKASMHKPFNSTYHEKSSDDFSDKLNYRNKEQNFQNHKKSSNAFTSRCGNVNNCALELKESSHSNNDISQSPRRNWKSSKNSGHFNSYRRGVSEKFENDRDIVKLDDAGERKHRGCIENGFFLKVGVSEEGTNIEYWVKNFKAMFSYHFDVERCCHFSDILILSFKCKKDAQEGQRFLLSQKKKMMNSTIPHVVDTSTLKNHLIKPCDCKQKIISDCIKSIDKSTLMSVNIIDEKICEIKDSKEEAKACYPPQKFKEVVLAKNVMLDTFMSSRSNFLEVTENIVSQVKSANTLKNIQQLKLDFIRECNAFKRCLPIYSRKSEILKIVRYYPVSVIVAETGSGKSTQLAEYLLYSKHVEYGLIICTQPRKLAAISIAQFVSGQIGSAVGKIVGYDVGTDKKCSDITKVIYMTDYCLLKSFLRNRNLKNISCIIIDEAHERSLYTDLLFGMLKQCLPIRPDLRVIITSATINPSIFMDYFNMKPEAVIEVSGRSYPVDVIWLPKAVSLGWNYLEASVRKAYDIHINEKKGDILVFLTSPVETEEAIDMFKRHPTTERKALLYCLHGKSDIKEQMQVFQNTQPKSRKIIFATNVAETAVTIPGIRYVVDSGMTKELMFDPKKNKNYLAVTFINKSSAEQRKGRAGRTQTGICYRMYSKTNFNEMTDNALPEILKTNLQKALLKIFELGIEPQHFDFIETPPKRTVLNSIDSLEYLGAIENNILTSLGKKLVKLPLEPQLSKLVLLGVETGIGYEAIIIAALVSEAGKLFIRFEDNREVADERKKNFLHEGGDLCTFLEIYKRWKEVDLPSRFNWCVHNFVSSKALNSAAKIVKEIIICLKSDLGISISKRYNSSFKKLYERVIFESFSENLCVSSGHSKLGYLSPYLSESFFIHPSSTLSYFGKDKPEYLVYSTLMETSRNFLFDVTPISEQTILKANEAGTFDLPLHSLKCLQIPPKILGPFGESVLIRHILGKSGTKIREFETKIMNFTNTKNVQLDVAVDKGLITIYVHQRYHEKITKDVYEVIEQAHSEMLKEEDVIKLSGTLMHYGLGAGGIINDIIMPEEFRELIFKGVHEKMIPNIENLLESYGPLLSIDHITTSKTHFQICATYKKVSDAYKAFSEISKRKLYNVSHKPYLPGVINKTLPLYMLELSWCCSPCNGTGWVEFHSEEDLIEASGVLTRESFFLDNQFVIFTPDYNSNKKLSMKNLPETADEKAVLAKVSGCLKDLEVKSVKVIRKYFKKTDDSIKDARKKLSQLFSRFTPATKLIIDVISKPNDNDWKACAYFECYEDGEEALNQLKGRARVNSYPVSIVRVLKSTLYCKTDIFNAVSKQIEAYLLDKSRKGLCEEYSIAQIDTMKSICVKFSCINFQELNNMRQSLMHLFNGESMDLIGNSKYHFLFSQSLLSHIERIQKKTKTFISLNKSRKIITIYGCAHDCKNAQEEIHKLATNSDLAYSRVFDLLDSHIPIGFIKQLYLKYGYNLYGLIEEFKLTMATIRKDEKLITLTLTGLKNSIRQAEKSLEKLCEELDESRGKRQKTDNTKESCPICLEPVSYDFHRLEHCGHAFCRQCLLLQLDSKPIPLICVKQDCEKLIFLEDIKRIISFGGEHLKKSFCAAALEYHVKCNIGKISYCPTPDCQKIYRVTEVGSEYVCPECRNSICTRCQTAFHYGMTCEMSEDCRKDEDFSVKVWMKEKESDRKQCPSCKTVIEKDSGCNHMECLNCKTHMCWLCLKVFPTGDEVYAHMPYCEKNQS